jgi:hypothetical protein
VQHKIVKPAVTRRILTPEEVRAKQKLDAEKDRNAIGAKLPAVVTPTDVTLTVVPALTSTADYFDRNPGRMVVGRPVRPNLKEGRWIFADDDTDLPEGAEYAALYDHTWAGWVRLEADQPPQYNGGLLFGENYARPSREELGDLDPTQWPVSQFDGQPTDPQKEAVYVPLENTESGEMLTIQIQSKPRSAAIFAVDGLLSHCRQLARRAPDFYPVIRLAIGSYESKKFGSQYKPVFQIVGKTPKAGTTKPDTSIGADMDDAIPLFENDK